LGFMEHKSFNQRLLEGLVSLRSGNFDVQLEKRGDGIDAQLAQAFNDIAQSSLCASKEFRKVKNGINDFGDFSLRVDTTNCGGWTESSELFNSVVDSLTFRSPTSLKSFPLLPTEI